MKVVLLLATMLSVAATALSYGTSVTAGMTVVSAHTAWATEPTTLLLSGSLLLGVAGLARRWPW